MLLLLWTFIFLGLAAAIEDAAHWDTVARHELAAAMRITHNLGVARNVVVFVGDGMGPNTVTASRLYRGQQRGLGSAAEAGLLSFEAFPHLGLLKTYSVDKQIPDSACSATALFSGVKANYETIGVDAKVKLADCEASLNKANQVDSIVKWAQDAGKLTGFVTTARVTHATPSGLYAHCPERRWECESKMPASASKCNDIARQLVEQEPGRSLRVIMGGGRQCLVSNITGTPQDPVDKYACYSKDGRDLISAWRKHKESIGVKFAEVNTTGGLRAIDPDTTDFVLGVFANGHMRYEFERDTSENGPPSLTEMTKTAVQILRKAKNGFLLMVEGANIDNGHHRGCARRALHETVEMDSAVRAVLELTNTEDTLVVVTADHAHALALSGYPDRGTDILGIASRSRADNVSYTTLSYSTGADIKYVYNGTHVVRPDPALEDTTSFDYKQQATVKQDEVKHGGSDVTVYALGPMAHLFHTIHEQNYVAYVVAYAARIGPYAGNVAYKMAPNSCLVWHLLGVIYALQARSAR